jgi:hypothetical protein
VVTKPTGRPRGRPRKERPPKPSSEARFARRFLRDPDRFAVAMLDAVLALAAGSERDCALAIAVLLVGVEGDQPRPDGARTVTNWLTDLTRRGAKAATPEGRASTLRVKQGRCRSSVEASWRKAIASAFMLAIGACDREVVRATVAKRVMASGEPDLARATLIVWRMIDAKLPGNLKLPEFPAEIVST